MISLPYLYNINQSATPRFASSCRTVLFSKRWFFTGETQSTFFFNFSKIKAYVFCFFCSFKRASVFCSGFETEKKPVRVQQPFEPRFQTQVRTSIQYSNPNAGLKPSPVDFFSNTAPKPESRNPKP